VGTRRIEHFFGVFGKDLRPAAMKKVIKGVNEIEIVRTKSTKELVMWRDEKLVELLKIPY